MLVLSRMKNQGIVCDTPVGQMRIVIVDVRGGKVRIGLEAPRVISIVRDDAWRRQPEAKPEAEVSG